MEPSRTPTRARQRFGIVLTLAVAVAWGVVVAKSARQACWPRTDLARGLETVGPIVVFGLIVIAGLIAIRRRGGEGDLIGYALALGILWLPHAELAERPTISGWGDPPRILRHIDAAQTLFREGDKDGDGTLDYGTLSELLAQGLLGEPARTYLTRDQPLAGYRYRIRVDPAQRPFHYLALAHPAEPDPLSPEPRYAIAYAVSPDGVVAGLAPLTPSLTGALPFPAAPDQLARLVAGRSVAQNDFWRHRAPLGARGTLFVFLLVCATLFAWVFELRPFRPYPGSVGAPGEDDVAS